MEKKVLIFFTIVLFFVTFISAEIPSEGLVSYWKFNENFGNTLGDEQGVNDGVLAGPTWANGIEGGALEFDGNGDYVDVGIFSIPGEELTISAWVTFRDDSRVYDSRIIAKGSNTNSQEFGLVFNDVSSTDGKWQARLRTSSGFTYSCEQDMSFPPVVDEWYHVLSVYDGVKLKLFMNGELIKEISQTGEMVESSDPVYIGWNKGSSVSQRGWEGKIDEIMIYNRALSNLEINNIYVARGLSGVIVVPTCSDECSPSESPKCDDGVRICGNYDADSCYEWSDSIMCAENEACVNGNCEKDVLPPTNETDGNETILSPVSNCIDSDDGFDYFTKGFVNSSGEITMDTCGAVRSYFYDKSLLKEYTCADDGVVVETIEKCPKWCIDGACVSEEISCIDTDGNNPYTSGNISGFYFWEEHNTTYDMPLMPEQCYKDENNEYTIMWEGYCENNELKFEQVNCTDACYKGACIDFVDPVCIDSEPVSDYLTRGVVDLCDEYGECITNNDVCLDEYTLSEAFCLGIDAWEWEYDCPGGCDGGVCVDDFFTPWDCSVSPSECPDSSVQMQTCIREEISTGDVYTREQEVNCVPGVCSGCEVGEECLDFGTRVDDSSYCALSGDLMPQKVIITNQIVSCVNDFECESNVCGTEQCVDLRAFIADFGKFKRAFSDVVCQTTVAMKIDETYEGCIYDRFTNGGAI